MKDRQSGDDFSHQQAQNGEATQGEYRVKLPDGRTQIVSYTADDSGYRADVSYEGNARLEPSEYKGYKEETESYRSHVEYNPDTSYYQADSQQYKPGAPHFQHDRAIYNPDSTSYQAGGLAYRANSPRHQQARIVYKTSPHSIQNGRYFYNTDDPIYRENPVEHKADAPGFNKLTPLYKQDATRYQAHYPSLTSNGILQEYEYSEVPQVNINCFVIFKPY